MDVKINVKGYEQKEAIIDKKTNQLSNKFGIYNFITTVVGNLTQVENNHTISLEMHLKKGNPIFAEAKSDVSSLRAFNAAVEKIEKQIEKYKEIHYKSSSRNVKGSNKIDMI